MVKNHTIISIPLITGDTDEVQVQSEEPHFKKQLSQDNCFFAFSGHVALHNERVM